jgi:hypothetical protein
MTVAELLEQLSLLVKTDPEMPVKIEYAERLHPVPAAFYLEYDPEFGFGSLVFTTSSAMQSYGFEEEEVEAFADFAEREDC